MLYPGTRFLRQFLSKTRCSESKIIFWQSISRGPEQALLRKSIGEIAETRVRYGYRRIHILLHREGWSAGRTRVYRLQARRAANGTKTVPAQGHCQTSIATNDFWSMDWEVSLDNPMLHLADRGYVAGLGSKAIEN